MIEHSKPARGLISAVALTASLVVAGCQTPTAGLHEPVVTPVTVPNKTLRTLPAPTERISVAVYDFPDLTGQYKERENVQTLSRAVTQGGATMLIKALQDAGERRWFSVLDRARLDDLLKERQIVTEMRRLYRNEQQIDPSALPPLKHAGIIMQGGIVGYDTNTVTGGVGARYLGIGGDTRYQQDTVTVTLRAVSTNTGEVLASVTVHKAIASRSLQAGVFQFIALDELLEAEAGITSNEPQYLAVQQAIEKAVRTLIIEGAELGVWSFQDRARGQEIIAHYRAEKYDGNPVLAAQMTVAPETTDPTRVVATTPVRAAAVSRPIVRTTRQAPPPAAAPAAAPAAPRAPAADSSPRTPPPPGEDETVGSLGEEQTPASPGSPAEGVADQDGGTPETTSRDVASVMAGQR